VIECGRSDNDPTTTNDIDHFVAAYDPAKGGAEARECRVVQSPAVHGVDAVLDNHSGVVKHIGEPVRAIWITLTRLEMGE
jgi:hypothetical protein